MYVYTTILVAAKSAGAVKYTDCTSPEGLKPSSKCPRYVTKQSDGETLGNAEYTFIAIVSLE